MNQKHKIEETLTNEVNGPSTETYPQGEAQREGPSSDQPRSARGGTPPGGCEPRIYVASLSDYNAGRLHGRMPRRSMQRLPTC